MDLQDIRVEFDPSYSNSMSVASARTPAPAWRRRTASLGPMSPIASRTSSTRANHVPAPFIETPAQSLPRGDVDLRDVNDRTKKIKQVLWRDWFTVAEDGWSKVKRGQACRA